MASVMIWICKLFIMVSILASGAQAQKRLIFVQELFRHGARFPIYPSYRDGSEYAILEHSKGQLTTQGKNMHYLLGSKIYQTYWDDLFQGTEYQYRYNQTKFYIKSTDVNRTIESCQSHLMGIFQNLKPLEITSQETPYSAPFWDGIEASAGPVFPNAQAFHPLPVHVEKIGANEASSGDFLKAYSPSNCPNQQKWSQQNKRSDFAEQVYKNEAVKKALRVLSDQIGLEVSFAECGRYYDNFETTLYLGRKTLPVFSSPEHARTLAYIYTLDLYINLFLTEKQIRATSSAFFEQTLSNIDRAINARDIQWVIYSAHDTTVGNMLAALNLTNAACIYEAFLKGEAHNNQTCIAEYPMYATSLIFEVYEDEATKATTFKIRYAGKYRKIPFCDWQQQCRVQKFREWFSQDIKIDDFMKECGIVDQQAEMYLTILVLLSAVILILMIIGFKAYVTEQRKKSIRPKKQKKQSLLIDDEAILGDHQNLG